MSWKKHFRVVSTQEAISPPQPSEGGGAGSASKYSSYLPEVYAGHPNRIQRYYQYDDMDRDSDINAALDTIADFCTQSEEQNDEPFFIKFNDQANETEIKLLKSTLNRWIKTNDFRSRLWYMFRNTIKNGDAFFLRDPETGEWLWLDHYSVEMVKVDDNGGKEPEEYIVRGLDLNRAAKYATKKADPSVYRTPLGTNAVQGARPLGAASASGGSFQLPGSNRDMRQQRPGQNAATSEMFVIDARFVVHLSLSVGMDINWPFGESILSPVFKTYKQKELLEDAIIIYRVQRAPERRVFKIDVGNMPPQRAKAHIEAIKNEIHQRRIPNRTGGGTSIMDAAYNPLSIMEDFFFAQGAEGRGSSVETLPGGDNLGEIGDLSFFTKKLARGLRIPSSYLALGNEESTAAYSDGRVGTALIQEFRFNKYCMRLQNLLAPVFDREFKKFLKDKGIEIDDSLFEIQFNPPQNFAKYRQIELDSQQVGVYQQVADNKRLSERFKLKRFLNLNEDELIENERLWAEENAAKLKRATGTTPAESNPSSADLSSVGIRPPMDDFGMTDMPPMETGPDDLPPMDPVATPPAGGPAGANPPVGGAQD